MAIDTEAKRWSVLQWASGPSVYPLVFNPETSGLAAIERATVLKLYGGIAWEGPTAEIALSGGPFTEAQIVAGGQTVVFTVTNDTWVATLGADNAITTAFLAGLDSDGAEAGGWDAQVSLTHSDLVRDSDTQVTLTLPATAAFDISANETITVTIPASALTTASSEVVASPTLTITFIAVTANTGGGRGAKRKGKYPRRVYIDGKLYWVHSYEEEKRLLAVYREQLDREALELALSEAPAEQIKKARTRIQRVERRIEKVDDRAQDWLTSLRVEDEEILMVYH